MLTFLFLTPEPADTPAFLADSSGAELGLWRHYKNRKRGVNVYLLNNGTFVQTTATPTLTEQTLVAAHTSRGPQPPWTAGSAQNTPNVPYPWNPTLPTAPYVEIFNWTGSMTAVYLTPRIKAVYYGGHRNRVNEEEAAALIVAGYGDCITPWTTT